MAKGIYRDNEDDWAMVDYGQHRAPIPRTLYEHNRYEPPFDDLPIKDRWEDSSDA